jgi:hypothetical protein
VESILKPEVQGADPHVNNMVSVSNIEIWAFFPPEMRSRIGSVKIAINCDKLHTLVIDLRGIDFLLIIHNGSMNDIDFLIKDAIGGSN